MLLRHQNFYDLKHKWYVCTRIEQSLLNYKSSYTSVFIMLIVIFVFCSILLLIAYGVFRHFYLEEKFETIIRKKFKSLGFLVVSIKNTEKPNFIEHDDFNLGFYSGQIIVTKYRQVQLEIDGHIKNSIVSLKRIGNGDISINCYLDLYGKGVYQSIE